MHLLFGVQLLYFVFHLLEGLSPLFNLPSFSPLVPHYAHYFTAIHAVSLLLVSLSGISGIVLLFLKKKTGWVLTCTATMCLFVGTLYYSILSSAFLFSLEDIFNILILLCLGSRYGRTAFGIRPANYILPIILTILFIVLKELALPLSMAIEQLTA